MNDLPIKTKDGRLIDVEFISNVYLVNKEKVIQCNIRDITKRKEIEKSLLQSNRALKTISAGNQALVHSKSEEELLGKVTDIIVRIGGYNLAVVNYVQDNLNKTIIPMAWSGLKKEHHWQVEFSWSETAKNQMPASIAIRTSKIQITHKIEEISEFKLWKNEILSLNYHSNIALPLIDNNRVFAVLDIYSSKTDIFKKEDEVRLLEELANDLAYGVIALRTRAANEEQAKIITVADVVEAITSHRPYRAALGIKVALDEIKKGRGIIYDEKVVDSCLNLFDKKEFYFSAESL